MKSNDTEVSQKIEFDKLIIESADAIKKDSTHEALGL